MTRRRQGGEVVPLAMDHRLASPLLSLLTLKRSRSQNRTVTWPPLRPDRAVTFRSRPRSK